MTHPDKNNIIIETERLLLRPFNEDDFDIIYRLYGDAEVLKYSPFTAMDTLQAQAHLDKVVGYWKCDPVTDMEFAVILKAPETDGPAVDDPIAVTPETDGPAAAALDKGRKIGRAHIHIEPEDSAAMIGWFLAQEHWGKGYATEIGRRILEYCFITLGLHRIYGLCNPGNTGSRIVMSRLGMREEALLKNKCPYPKLGPDHYEDEMIYAILNEEWLAMAN